MIFGRLLHTHPDLLHPNVKDQVMYNQMKQKQHYDTHCKQHQFKVGDTVYVKDSSGKEGWLPSKITNIQGLGTYLIELEDERVVCRHVDHVNLRLSFVEPVDEQNDGVEELLPLVTSEVSETQAELNTDTAQQPVRTHKCPTKLIEELD